MRLGEWGEAEAARWLEGKGYRILARNYRQGPGEIDLIAETGQTLVFVEVKTRRSVRYGLPCEAITPEKRRRLLRTAACYLLAHPAGERTVRIDVLEVAVRQGRPCFRQIRNAVELNRS